MPWMTSLKGGERCVQLVTSSAARSKFLTYSPYILRNGASFCRTSPSRGFVSLWGGGRLGWGLRREAVGCWVMAGSLVALSEPPFPPRC